jgi:hypothetical protein
MVHSLGALTLQPVRAIALTEARANDYEARMALNRDMFEAANKHRPIKGSVGPRVP